MAKLISIIIPTLNEENYLGETIGQIYKSASRSEDIEIIVVDSGSSDRTVKIVESFTDVSLYERPDFKGKKYEILNCGASKAAGDFFLFIDADTMLPADFDLLIRLKLTSGQCIGGAFEFSFDHTSHFLRFVQYINRIRYRITGDFYGDQGIFCKREVFEKINGFPPKVILESAYLCRSLRKIGKMKLVKQKIITSSRRFTMGKSGPLLVFLNDVKIYLLDLWGFGVESDARSYWDINASKKW